jgi:hypothetical protein
MRFTPLKAISILRFWTTTLLNIMKKELTIVPAPITYKYKEEIASDLGISLSTLKRWLRKHNLNIPRGYVSPQNQQLIHEKFGLEITQKAHANSNTKHSGEPK